jgi:hypothetical protein
VRGKPARTVDDMKAQFDVVEYLLTSKAGLSHRDIHGEDRDGYHVRRRHDIAATARRVLGRVGRRRFAMGVATVGTTAGVTAALAGLESVGVYLASIVYLLAWACYRYAPDVVFDDDVPAAVTVTKSRVEGLSQNALNRRLLIHTKREEVKEEKLEKRRKRQERKQKVRGGR